MRTVIISHNNDPLYSFFEPIVKWAWYKFGWDCRCIEAKTVTNAQICRLFAGSFYDDDRMLMLSDIDMLPLSDYWQPEDDKITCYGRDLSIEHQPICYVAMNSKNMHDMMGEFQVFEDKHWTFDQDYLTYHLHGWPTIQIERGIDDITGYPIGRIDRSSWDKSLQQPLRIDAHLLRPGYTDENWPRIMNLIKECLNPTEQEIIWLENYRTEWIKSH